MNEFKKSLEVKTDKKEKADDKENKEPDRVKIFEELIRKYNEEAWEK